jgi:hypothetical protein
MKCRKKEGARLVFVTMLLIALCFSITFVANAQKPVPPSKGAPATQEKKAQPAAQQGQGGAQAQKGAEYAACSPDFPAAQIADLMDFVATLSKDLPGKLKPVLLKCDVDVNRQLLGFLADMQQNMGDVQFENEDQEKRFLNEKAKEVEVQLVMVQEPIKEAELKKLMSDLFDIKQQDMKDEAAGLEKEAAAIKKRVEERQKLKDQIVDRKLKEMTSENPPKPAEGAAAGEDKLSWEN